MHGPDLDQLETTTYRESFADGVFDIFGGLGLIWIGASWLWFDAIGPLATILPAALAPMVVPLRRRLIEPRAGYVRWAAPRRTWERRQLIALVMVGVGALGLAAGLAIFDLRPADGVDMSSFAAAIPAVLVAIPVIILAAASGLRRVWGYAAVLLLAAAATVAVAPQPGWPLFVGGVVMLGTGVVLLARFLRTTSAGVNA